LRVISATRPRNSYSTAVLSSGMTQTVSGQTAEKW